MVACSALMIALPVNAQEANRSILAITNGTLIDGTGAPPIADAVVIIEGDQIVAAGPTSTITIPAAAQIIDAQGGTILPGIIDSHVHSLADPGLRRRFLLAGVTSVCDVGSPLVDIATFAHLSTTQGPAARGFRAGPIITVPGGLPGAVFDVALNYEVATPDEARAAVIDLKTQGADMLKIYLDAGGPAAAYPMLDQAQVNAIVDEAHTQGLVVRAHVTSVPALEIAISGGVDVIDHVPLVEFTDAEGDMIMQSLDPGATLTDLIAPKLAELDPLLAQAAEQHIRMVPTLARVYREIVEPLPDSIRQPVMDSILATVRRYHELGGPLALGTDYNIGVGLATGMPLEELDWLLDAGLTPQDILTASTREAAAACGQAETLGTLEPGKLGDVIVVAGDPGVDIHALAGIEWVITGGEIAVQPD